ncbi:hypothetical protein [Acetobacterium bakii]|uniref:hypothetical protein n=1 Tax=Acetobacterium bakii TaxID=52689 RepID=UPI000F8D6C85|nr:hypothetical protein [Acetobacterium bakii]
MAWHWLFYRERSAIFTNYKGLAILGFLFSDSPKLYALILKELLHQSFAGVHGMDLTDNAHTMHLIHHDGGVHIGP